MYFLGIQRNNELCEEKITEKSKSVKSCSLTSSLFTMSAVGTTLLSKPAKYKPNHIFLKKPSCFGNEKKSEPWSRSAAENLITKICLLPTQWPGWIVASYYKRNFSVVSEDVMIISVCVCLVLYMCVCARTLNTNAELNHSDLYCSRTHTHQNTWKEPMHS